MKKNKKADTVPQMMKYLLAILVSTFIIIFGYNALSSVTERTCIAELAKFKIDLKYIDTSIPVGSKELQSYNVPCDVDEIYFLDENVDPEFLNQMPLIKDSIESKAANNIFLVKDDKIKSSFYSSDLEVEYPYYKCLAPQFGKISFFLEGTKTASMITSTSNQPECTLIPVRITVDETDSLLAESSELISELCANCVAAQIEQTRDNTDIGRKFETKDDNKKTRVEIVVSVEDGKRLKNFVYIESIPKDCISNLEDYLNEDSDIEREGANVRTKNDKLILWFFEDIKDEKKVAYKINKVLSEECKSQFKGLGIAQIVEQDTSD